MHDDKAVHNVNCYGCEWIDKHSEYDDVDHRH